MIENSEQNISYIKQLCPGAVSITQPRFLGAVHPVYLVQTDSTKIIFRFSTKECAFKNAHISIILKKYGIPAPEISVHKIGDTYCETYPFIEGKTLYERYCDGLSPEKIKNVFNQLIGICQILAKISPKELANLDKVITRQDLFFYITGFSKNIVGHNDLHDKNILLDENDNICAIVDLDSISLHPIEVYLMTIFKNASEYGYGLKNIGDFYDVKQKIGFIPDITQRCMFYEKARQIKRLFAKHVLQNRQK